MWTKHCCLVFIRSSRHPSGCAAASHLRHGIPSTLLPHHNPPIPLPRMYFLNPLASCNRVKTPPPLESQHHFSRWRISRHHMHAQQQEISLRLAAESQHVVFTPSPVSDSTLDSDDVWTRTPQPRTPGKAESDYQTSLQHLFLTPPPKKSYCTTLHNTTQ